MNLINRIRARLEYYHEHLIVSVFFSALGFLAIGTHGLLAGPVFYILRELNQYHAGRTGRDWPEGWISFILGRPSARFDKDGLLWPQAPLIVWALGVM